MGSFKLTGNESWSDVSLNELNLNQEESRYKRYFKIDYVCLSIEC